jgi:N-carbamoylputrescine amidase
VSDPKLITALGEPPPSFARVKEPTRAPLRVGAVQHRWHPDADAHRAALAAGVALAAEQGATLVCLQELTLSPYFAITADGPQASGAQPEPVPDGPTCAFAAVSMASTCTPRCTSAPTARMGWASTPRS